MFRRFYPTEYKESAYGIDYHAYFLSGKKGVIFDIDNTLVPHGEPADERVLKLFGQLHSMGMKTMLLSNNKEPRVKAFAEQVQSEYIYKAGKPGKKGYLKAMEQMGTTVDSTLFVGDQLFTDVFGANRLKMQTILVKPIHPKEEIQIVLKRYLEKIVLYFYKKRCN